MPQNNVPLNLRMRSFTVVWEYAQRYGFPPHRDFTAQMCDQVLDPPETHARTNHVKFGKKGKPLFIAGPYDDERRIKSVINTLMSTAGEGNFDYVVGFGPPDISNEDAFNG
jgi:hypothetical protein